MNLISYLFFLCCIKAIDTMLSCIDRHEQTSQGFTDNVNDIGV